MDWPTFQSWIATSSLVRIGLVLFGAMCVAAGLGVVMRLLRRRGKGGAGDEGGEGYVVSAVLGLLALLMGFTFSLAVDRFETRRQLVLAEANAIGTTYLRAQLLTEPHRARMSDLLRRYVDNRIALAKAHPDAIGALVVTNDALVTDIWTATKASFPSIQGLDFSSAYLDSVNAVIDLDASRKMARAARVPITVFGVLFIYLVTTAGVLGYVLTGWQGRGSAVFLLVLLTLSLMLIIDIDRPAMGAIQEGQVPMEALRRSLDTWPPAVFDRWGPSPTAPD
jgi:hypothetical protein